MLRHIGQKRTNTHNLKLAGLLSFTAGFVNAAGFLSFSVLTTNVTGHVALFAERLATGDSHSAWIVGTWMLMFFLGAFFSSMIINVMGRNQRFAYTIPIVIEIIILLLAGCDVHWFKLHLSNLHFTAGCLLFAMGLQNAMVSMISGSVVRTTHLTGMFTDLGIELAAYIQGIGKGRKNYKLLLGKMLLRVIIIAFFFGGCVLSAFSYHLLRIRIFFIPAGLLIIGMLFDIFRIQTIRLYHKLKYQK